MLGTLQEMMDDMERGVYDFTQGGECSNCGQCCSRFLPISAKEVKTIKRYIQKNHIEEQRHLLPTSSLPPPIPMTGPVHFGQKRSASA